jgi:hypothetical protein
MLNSCYVFLSWIFGGDRERTRALAGRRKPLKITAHDDTITIAFNAAGWNPAHAKLLQFLGGKSGMPIAEFIGNAIEYYGRSQSKGGKADFDLLMECLQIEVKKDEDCAAGKLNVPPSLKLWPDRKGDKYDYY